MAQDDYELGWIACEEAKEQRYLEEKKLRETAEKKLSETAKELESIFVIASELENGSKVMIPLHKIIDELKGAKG